MYLDGGGRAVSRTERGWGAGFLGVKGNEREIEKQEALVLASSVIFAVRVLSFYHLGILVETTYIQHFHNTTNSTLFGASDTDTHLRGDRGCVHQRHPRAM